jgi:hypothetical protein
MAEDRQWIRTNLKDLAEQRDDIPTALKATELYAAYTDGKPKDAPAEPEGDDELAAHGLRAVSDDELEGKANG